MNQFDILKERDTHTAVIEKTRNIHH